MIENRTGAKGTETMTKNMFAGYRLVPVKPKVRITPKWYDFLRRLHLRAWRTVGILDPGKLYLDKGNQVIYCRKEDIEMLTHVMDLDILKEAP